jgi:hypothetical protein
VDRFWVISSSVVMTFPKCEVNLGSRLLMILRGRPNHLNTLSRYNLAICGPVIMEVHGRNIMPLEQPWSTMVRMVL